MKSATSLFSAAILLTIALTLSACTPATEPGNEEPEITPPATTETGAPETGNAKASEWKEFADASMTMEYPSKWTYQKEEIAEPMHAFFMNTDDSKEDKLIILPKGGYDHGLPFGDGEVNEEVMIGGKKARKIVWKTESDKAIGYIKFSQLPTGWTENNRIEFTTPYDQLGQVNQVLDSIEFL